MGVLDRFDTPKPISWLLNWSRKYSLWMFQWGLACCAIEMGAALASPRYDMMRLGVIPFPASPRQADLVVISTLSEVFPYVALEAAAAGVAEAWRCLRGGSHRGGRAPEHGRRRAAVERSRVAIPGSG